MHNFKLGDLIVYRNFYINDLLRIDLIMDEKTVGYRGAKRHFMKFEGCTQIDEIRLATKEEIKNGYRTEE